jgi:hypothetical protein
MSFMTKTGNSDIKPMSPNLFDPTKVYGLEAVGKHFGVSLRQAQRWAKLPGFPKSETRWYSLVAIAMWREEQKNAPTKTANDEGQDPDDDGVLPQPGSKKHWELEDKKYQAQTRELEFRRRQGELVERLEVEQLFVARIVAVTQGLESLARALPPLLVNKSEREMEPVIARRVRALRELFARPLPEKFGSADKEEVERGKVGRSSSQEASAGAQESGPSGMINDIAPEDLSKSGK